MDDVFGGTNSKTNSACLIKKLILVGKLTTAVMNLLKCQGPAQVLDILGLRYDAILRRVTIPEGKRSKYLCKLREAFSSLFVTFKDIEKPVGYLGYAS